MFYETNTATGVNDMLSKLSTALAANGWTIDKDVTEGAGRRLQVHKTSAGYFTMRSFVSETPPSGSSQAGAIFGLPCTGYNGSNAWYDQPGVPTYTNFGTQYNPAGMVNIVGALASYHLFIDSAANYDLVYLFVEYPAGSWQHFGFGRLDTSRFGTVVGGQFMFGGATVTQTVRPAQLTLFGPSVSGFNNPAPTGYVYIDHTDYTGWVWSNWVLNSTQLPAPRLKDTIYKCSSIWHCSPNALNSRAPMRPIGVLITNDGFNFAVSTPLTLVGEFPLMYWINLKNYNPAQTVNISTDTYKVFPMYKKSDDAYNQFDPEVGTMWFGLAVRSN